MPTGTLPASGKKLWEEVYNKALKGSCKDDKECAAKTAWSAVEGAGWKKDKDGKWHKASEVAEFSMTITRASYDKATNEMRWKSSASDTENDLYDDNMTLELFADFMDRIRANDPAPEEFRSSFWVGGMPYLSVSHYPDLDGKAVPGTIESVYVDGNFLKSDGTFYDTPLGRAAFKAVNDDLYGKNKDGNAKVRISIAFIDWKHRHKDSNYIFERKSLDDVCPECFRNIAAGVMEGKAPHPTLQGPKEYLRGQLIHEAMTRVPVNTRTLMEVERSMTTRKEDAASIIGEEEADLIEEQAKLVGKSQALVIKADEEMSECKDGESPEDCQKRLKEEEAAEGDSAPAKSEVEVEKATKKEGDCSHPSSHYLVAEDSTKPTTWHLRVKNCSGELDHRLMGAAWAALHGGYRGNTYSGPNKSKAISKLKGMYSSENLTLPSEKSLVEDAEVEKMYAEDPEMEWRPYGGATSMQEAQAIIEAQKEQFRISDLWWMFQDVASNIMADATIEDKGKAISQAASEFKTMLGDQTSKAMLNLMTMLSTVQEPVSMTPTHPLDIAVSALKAQYDTLLASGATGEAFLQGIQEPYSALGEAIKSSALPKEDKPVIEDSPLVAQVNQLSQAVNLILTKLDGITSQPRSTPVIPARRGIDPRLIKDKSEIVSKSTTPVLRSIIERTTN